MTKLLSIRILAAGIVLIIYGVNGTQSVASAFSRLFSGSPTDKSVWMLVGGLVIAGVGAGRLIAGSRST